MLRRLLFGLATSASGASTNFTAGAGARVLGVTSVNKTGAGTFVIVGTPLNQLPLLAVNPWTMDIGSLNIGTAAANGGELQLTLTTSPWHTGRGWPSELVRHQG